MERFTSMVLPANSRLCLLMMLFLPAFLYARVPILERTLTVHLDNTLLKEGLDVVAAKANFEWSYNAAILPSGKRISLITRELTVRETLLRILGAEYNFKQNGNYLILKKEKKPEQKVSGYISDSKTGKRVPNATIYDRNTLRATTTDADGYYELTIKDTSAIVIARQGYRGRVVEISQLEPRFMATDIESVADIPAPAFSLPADTTDRRNDYRLKSQRQWLNGLNVRDTLHRIWQISFLPTIGTNFSMSGQVINDYSINVLAGYSRGNRVFEVGGIGNITRENVEGVQVGGVFNSVFGNMRGVQFGGVWNTIGDTLYGGQFAGVWNHATYNRHAPIQVAGVANSAFRGVNHTQFAGAINQADTIIGVQVAGALNHTKMLKGSQIAGALNTAVLPKAGNQTAGAVNIAWNGNIDSQIAGALNIADTVRGCQISGAVNVAVVCKGVQIGIVNYADSLAGIQIGLFNVARRGGYRTFEAGWNDLTAINTTWKSGAPGFYWIWTAGITPRTENLWCYGAGLGTHPAARRRVSVSLDAIQRHVNIANEYPIFLQEWSQLAPAIHLRLWRGLSLAAGPTANLFISNTTDANYEHNIAAILPADRLFRDEFSGNIRLSYWVGGMAAIRYRF